MVSAKTTVINPQGMHMRPAQVFVGEMGKFKCDGLIVDGGGSTAILSPDERTRSEYLKRQEEFLAKRSALEVYRHQATTDKAMGLSTAAGVEGYLKASLSQ